MSRAIRRALLSVTDKTGLVEFAARLDAMGVELVSTGGTAKALRDAKLPVRDISDLTGFPEMLDGRVKTLHPRVHGGILHVRDNAAHVAAVEAHGIEPIDMVVVNLYAFEQFASKPGVHFAELIENIDIGGPSMVRSAAKNFADVAIVTEIANALELLTPPTGGENELALASPHPPLPKALRLNLKQKGALRYGENPHQAAALYTDGTATGVVNARQLQGKELSFNNLVDLDACWEMVREFTEPAVVIVKHTNPCGAATGASVLEAYERALAADPVSAFGGVIGTNRTVDTAAAEVIAKLFVEAIVAPAYTPEAVERFATKKNLRLLEIAPSPSRPQLKQVSGGMLVQEPDTAGAIDATMRVVTVRQPTDEELGALRFAWAVCKHVKSNAIVYARTNDDYGQTVGVGAGQMSRVDAARFGAMKAVLPMQGTVAASDAFFPFADGLEVVAQAGATAVIQPGGSVRDVEVIAAADRLGIAMIFTGTRHFRHG